MLCLSIEISAAILVLVGAPVIWNICSFLCSAAIVPLGHLVTSTAAAASPRSLSAILRRGGVFHQELHALALNDLFVATKSCLRDEFLAGYIKDAQGIIVGTPPRSPASSSTSLSYTSSSFSTAPDPQRAP